MDWLNNRRMMKMKSIRKTIILSLPFILLFSLALPISHADEETEEIMILPEWQSVYFNQTFTIDVVINTTVGAYGAQCIIEFDPNLIEVENIEKGSLLVGDAIFFSNYDNIEGKVNIQAFNISFELNQSFPMYHGVLANIEFKAKENVGVSSLNFITKIGESPETFFDNNRIPKTYNASVEIRNPPVYINITPSHRIVGNESANYIVNIDPNGNNITFIMGNISYNSSVFEASVTNGDFFASENFNYGVVDGKITMFGIEPLPGKSEPNTLLNLQFTPLQSGTTEINLSISSILDANGNHLYYETQNATLEADLTPPDVTFEFGTPYYSGSNWITSSTPLYINATDAHDYTIYYRIWNGSWQEWQSGLINTDIVLHLQNEGMYYIEYYAKDEYNNTSPVGNVTIYVDNTAPVTTPAFTPASPDGENGWYASNVTVTLASVDDGCGVASIYYRIDDGAITEYVGAFVVTEGNHIIYYYAVDNLGNQEEVATQEIKVDETAPSITYEIEGTEGNNGWYTSTVTITLNATDAVSGIQEVKYMVDGGTWQDYTEPFALSDGIHTIKYFAKDNAGNNVSGEMQVSVDTTKPTATHTLQGTLEDGKYTTDVKVTLSAGDNLAGVKEIRYRLDGGTWQIFTGASGMDTVSEEKTHTIEYYAVDNAGNAGTVHQVTFTIEKNKKPVADFTYTPAEPTDLDTITFVDQSTDEDGDIVSWFWEFGDGTTSTQQSPTHKYEDNGTYVVKLTVKDDKNATSTKQVAIVVANDPPTAKFTFNPAKPKIGDEIEFTSQAYDNDGTIVSYLWDFGDGNTSTEQNPKHTYDKTGTYNVTLTVTDNDGATHTQTQEIKVTKEEVNIWLYLIIIVILVIIAAVVVAVWMKRTKS